MKTLAEITLPKGINVWAKSASLKSCGKWYINKFAPSGPVKKNYTNVVDIIEV